MKRFLTVLLTLLTVAVPASASAAASHRLQLSWDGRSWATSLTGTLFNRAGTPRLWVPGDGDTKSFYVRDRGATPASLLIQYRWPSTDSLVTDHDFDLSVRVAGGQWRPLTAGTSWVAVGQPSDRRRGSARVDVRAIFHGASTNQSQEESVPLRFRVTMSGLPKVSTDTPGHHGSGTGSGGAGSDLPDTGAPDVRWIVLAALLCLGGGTAIVVASRRKERDDEQA